MRLRFVLFFSQICLSLLNVVIGNKGVTYPSYPEIENNSHDQESGVLENVVINEDHEPMVYPFLPIHFYQFGRQKLFLKALNTDYPVILSMHCFEI